ncbi:MAG TPA: type VI secretion system tip protein TssI/VgrG [Candidatus Acidoferrales bacterium]|nr:type VI secretion system tip protein TssI/VgrG [Candidatus Acidoferrales bacterium]
MPSEFKNVLLQIDTPLDGAQRKFFLRSFSGLEQMSRIFEFQLDLFSTDVEINFDQIIGKSVTISMLAKDGSVRRFFNGFINRFSQSDSDNDGAHYQATLVPWLWFLTRTTDCLIFQDKSVPDIVKAVAKRHGFESFLDVQVDSSKFRPWEYSVQYRETAANFIMRLMEQEGIFFFFRHEKGSHKMVVGDAPSHNKPCPVESSFRFAPRTGSGGGHQEETIKSWQFTQEIRTGKYSLNDFNFKNSTGSLLISEPSRINQGGNTKFESYDYPGEYETRDEGNHYTRARMEEEEAPHAVVTGTSNCLPLTPGFRVTVSKSQRKDQDGTYLLTSVNHSAFEGVGSSGEGGSDYTNNFECIPIAVPFRPARTTPRPLMQGTQTATVVTPEGEDFLVDKFGRVKVRFHWDRETQRDDKDIKDEERSCFIRVSQPWAGTNWGAIWLPRKGQEVIVDFLEGDPDQPIITGRVYNDKNMPPCTLPDHQTRSGIISRSTPNGSSSTFNSIIFEDKKGSELLRIHAERSLTESVEADSREYVGNDRLASIGHDRKTHIKEHDNLHIEGHSRLLIEGDSSIHVQGSCSEQIESDYSLEATDGIALHAGKISINVDEYISINGPGGFVKIDASGVTIMGTMVLINSGGAPSVAMPAPPHPPDEPDDKHGGVKNS